MIKFANKYALTLLIMFNVSVFAATTPPLDYKYSQAIRAYEDLRCRTTVALLTEYISEAELPRDTKGNIQKVIDWCVAYDQAATPVIVHFSAQGIIGPKKQLSPQQIIMKESKPKLPNAK
jgi:hypothetical protein